MFEKNSVILFQGDSITDAGRNKGDENDLGSGYPAIVKKILDKRYPELNIRVINRGISGNRAIDLVGRWRKDCIDLKPYYVSILIGVNDTWRRYDSNDPTNDADFKDRYKTIIEDTLKNTSAKLILLNPYLLDVNENVTRMREDLCGKQRIVRDLAYEYDTKYLDLEFAFRVAGRFKKKTYFSDDGVHPVSKGHELIADLWVEALED